MLSSVFAVQGMTCGACTAAITNAVQHLEGVESVAVSLITERAQVVHDSGTLSADDLREAYVFMSSFLPWLLILTRSSIEDCGFDAQVLASTELETASSSSSSSVAEPSDKSSLPETVFIKIYGMTCSNCTNSVEATLNALPGVSEAVVALATEEAKVTYIPAQIGIRDIVDAVSDTGFDAILSDMTSNSSQLESLARIKDIRMWRSAAARAISLAVPVMFINMVLPMLVKPEYDFGTWTFFIPGLHLRELVSLSLTLPTQFYIGRRFYVSAYRSLKHGSPTMDVLVALSTSTAFAFSCVAMIDSILDANPDPPSTVFETAAMIIAFITYGKYLENRAKGQTSAALSRLISLAPPMATIYVDPKNIAANPAEREVASELIQVGDIAILRPGAKAPADGIVVAGSSYMDESLVTGEPMPVEKAVGAPIIGGTINGVGRIDFRVTRAGKDTQLSQIVNLVQDAQTTRAPIQRFADVIAGKFVPVVIGLAIFTFAFWMVLSHALKQPPIIFDSPEGKFFVCLKLCISVIVVACPCALGLSTPTAVMVGTGIGAQNGILIKGGAVLEQATHITKMVFDKTGTLTVGKMSVISHTKILTWDSSVQRQDLWWRLVRAVERGSEHPIGKAIVAEANVMLDTIVVEGEDKPEETVDSESVDFEAVMGRGIRGAVKIDKEGYNVAVGNLQFMTDSHIKIPDHVEREAEATTSTAIFVGIDGVYAGSLSLNDIIRPDARATILALQKLGISVAMVTGDQRAPALRVAREIGIPDSQVWAGVTPSEKQSIIKRMQAQDPRAVIAMVGDGINDSPALVTAHVGLAMATGTDVAIEAADIVLMRPDTLLMDTAVALSLCRTIFNRIKANLVWASVYNVIMIPFAMGVFLPVGWNLPPMAAGGAMALSSVSVVTSSLALKRWKRPYWSTDEGRLDRAASRPRSWPVRFWRAVRCGVGKSRGSNATAEYSLIGSDENLTV
ncbi:E1-E2 ATPase-domain-containing protein [Kockiozyma suomiensis]|uniref:E1-E2 ATPase-domain-containing protein n=1 Tax=Kockiozyma suomiensis TaxID=1337062 RepID=UPI003343688F